MLAKKIEVQTSAVNNAAGLRPLTQDRFDKIVTALINGTNTIYSTDIMKSSLAFLTGYGTDIVSYAQSLDAKDIGAKFIVSAELKKSLRTEEGSVTLLEALSLYKKTEAGQGNHNVNNKTDIVLDVIIGKQSEVFAERLNSTVKLDDELKKIEYENTGHASPALSRALLEAVKILQTSQNEDVSDSRTKALKKWVANSAVKELLKPFVDADIEKDKKIIEAWVESELSTDEGRGKIERFMDQLQRETELTTDRKVTILKLLDRQLDSSLHYLDKQIESYAGTINQNSGTSEVLKNTALRAQKEILSKLQEMQVELQKDVRRLIVGLEIYDNSLAISALTADFMIAKTEKESLEGREQESQSELQALKGEKKEDLEISIMIPQGNNILKQTLKAKQQLKSAQKKDEIAALTEVLKQFDESIAAQASKMKSLQGQIDEKVAKGHEMGARYMELNPKVQVNAEDIKTAKNSAANKMQKHSHGGKDIGSSATKIASDWLTDNLDHIRLKHFIAFASVTKNAVGGAMTYLMQKGISISAVLPEHLATTNLTTDEAGCLLGMFNATMDEKQFVSVLNGNIATSLKSSPVYSYFKLQDASKPSTGMGVE